jgi:hypothetical protein
MIKHEKDIGDIVKYNDGGNLGYGAYIIKRAAVVLSVIDEFNVRLRVMDPEGKDRNVISMKGTGMGEFL